MIAESGTPIDPVSPPSAPPRPVLALRVGVTGARDLATWPEARRVAIREQIRAILAAMRDAVVEAGRDSAAREVYADADPRLRLLSPLAEGADRVVAEIAEGLGYEIDVALPFARAEYARDFSDPDSRAAFERWLGPEGEPGSRSYLALDGRRSADETASYEAVGRLVVRNCDLLIAVWDGLPARGRGGTGDIVRFGIRTGVPVWWIDTAGTAPPRLLQAAADLRAPLRAPCGADAAEGLARLFRQALLPVTHRRDGHGPIGRQTHRLLGPGGDPLDAFLDGPPPRRNPLWGLHGAVFRLLGGAPAPPPEARPAPDGPAAYWEALYRPADRAASAYADRYRSSYVWIFVLAGLAVVCAIAAQLQPPWELAAAAGEAALFGLILALAAASERGGWHARWIACRLLAELCRKQGALAALGWSLPLPDLRRNLGADGGGAYDPEPRSPEAWVGWYFDAMVRAAPLPHGDLAGPRLAAARDHARGALVEEQRRYHRDRRTRSRRASLRLARIGEIAFLAALALALVKLAVLAVVGTPGMAAEAGRPDAAGLVALVVAVAAILPAAAAAAFGIRAYAELELLEARSARMARLMTAAAGRIDGLDLARPLASEDLAAEVMEVSAAMLQEVGGWADLFRVKAVEAG